MKKNLRLVCFLSLILCVSYSLNSQNIFAGKTATPACDNEDFELGPVGQITSSNAISGWTSFKLTYPLSGVSNCNSMTSTAVTRSNPTSTSVETYSVAGLVDPFIGSSYPIYSVFGSGTVNGGPAFNPLIPKMYGNVFVRVNNTSTTPYSFHTIEKKISVTAANALFRFAYISVVYLGNGCCSGPAVKISFYNASAGNTLLACPAYSVNAPGPSCVNPLTPPLYACPSDASMYYHRWKIEAVDLSPYVGSDIIFRLGAFHCDHGCPKQGYAYLDAQCSPMQIYVNNIPFPAHTNSVTFMGCGVPTATVVAPPDFATYQWTGPAGFTSTASTISTSATGVYTLNIGTSGTCSTITKYVNIGIYPAATVTVTSSVPVLCKGKPVVITASGLTSYTWNIQPNTPSITVSPQSNTTYTVSGYDTNGCFVSSTITQSVVSCVGVNSMDVEDQEITLFPNPNKGEFVLLVEKQHVKGELMIENGLGQLVYKQNVTSGENKIHIKGLAPGIYYFGVTFNRNVLKKGKIQVE